MSNDAADCLSQTPRAERLQLVPGFHFVHLVLLRQVLCSHPSTKVKQDRPLRLLFRCVVVLPVRPSCKKVHAVSQNLVDIHRISRKNVWVVFCTWHIERLWTLLLTNQSYLSTRAAKLATRNSCCRLFSGSLVSDLLVKLQAIHRVYLCPQHFVSPRGFFLLLSSLFCVEFGRNHLGEGSNSQDSRLLHVKWKMLVRHLLLDFAHLVPLLTGSEYKTRSECVTLEVPSKLGKKFSSNIFSRGLNNCDVSLTTLWTKFHSHCSDLVNPTKAAWGSFSATLDNSPRQSNHSWTFF